MYNLRYHLVTICSIFLALAIGLLLGAAIAGSDLVRDTSQGLVDSLLEEFNDITQENNELTNQIEVERPLTQQLLGYWQDGQWRRAGDHNGQGSGVRSYRCDDNGIVAAGYTCG